jgi:hypothetical protein
MQALNCYIRVLKAHPSIQVREDGDCYLETTYNATQICGDTIATLQDKDECNICLYRTLTYLNHEIIQIPCYQSIYGSINTWQNLTDLVFAGISTRKH